MRKPLPTAAEFHAAIIEFIATGAKLACEKYISTILKENGRPRLLGFRSDSDEMKVALFLLTWKVLIEKDKYESFKTTSCEPSRENKYIYEELCKWNNVDELPDYSGSFALAYLHFAPLNITYK